MAHEFESGMFVRQPAWHTLGNVLTEAPDTDTAYQKSGLDWEVIKTPLLYKRNIDGIDIEFLTDENAIVRRKDNKYLGHCGRRYELYQNIDAFKWCAPLVESGYWKWESAGSLRGGKICWSLLKQSEIQLIPNDHLKNYLMINWSHDGSRSVQIVPTSIRVVCMNTLQTALREDTLITRVKHTKTIIQRMEEAKEIYRLSTEIFRKRDEEFKNFIDTDWDDNQLETFVKKVFPVEEELNGKAKTIAEKIQEQALSFVVGDYTSGAKELGIKNTAYGALMAMSEFNEHYLGGNRIKDRGFNILFSKGKEMNEKAYTVAKQLMAA